MAERVEHPLKMSVCTFTVTQDEILKTLANAITPTEEEVCKTGRQLKYCLSGATYEERLQSQAAINVTDLILYHSQIPVRDVHSVMIYEPRVEGVQLGFSIRTTSDMADGIFDPEFNQQETAIYMNKTVYVGIDNEG